VLVFTVLYLILYPGMLRTMTPPPARL